MKITGIDLYQIDIPINEPKQFPNRTYASFDNTIVCLQTDTEHVGWAEVCPIASTYQPEHAEGVRAALGEMAPGLMGLDPTQTGVVNAVMEDWLMGGLNAKSTIDIACWDLVGKAHGKPLYQMIGGALQERARGYCAVEFNETAQIARDIKSYRAKGYRHFQIKNKTNDVALAIDRIRTAGALIGPDEVMVVDANKAWKTHEALRICRATEDVDYYIEQPCLTYEECLSIRRQVRQPMILDECMADIRVMLRALADDCFEGIGCKITRVGGITGTRLIKDVCVAAGKVLTIDDMWGADLSAAAQAHLAVTSSPATCLASYISTDFSQLRYDMEAPAFKDGFIQPNEKPGLGVEPDMSILGEPIAQLR